MDRLEQGVTLLPLIERNPFPDPSCATKEGLLAYGGDLSPQSLLCAYVKGIFPWYAPNEPILWWSPDPRLILYPGNFIVRKSFRKVLRNRGFTVCFDQRFDDVIHLCASTPRQGQEGTWIVPEMQKAYTQLHRLGWAHSVEVYLDNKLVGGLYGIAMGKAFFGESMFSQVKDASKVALKALNDVLAKRGYHFIDCQVPTKHLMRLGAQKIARSRFLDELSIALQYPSDRGYWHDFTWTYEDDHEVCNLA